MENFKKHTENIKFTRNELEHIRKMQEDSAYLNSMPMEALKRYAGKYVAIKNRKIVAARKKLSALHHELERKNIHWVLISQMEGPTMVVYY